MPLNLPELPKIETGPNGPEAVAESPETGASFEAPKPAAETAAEALPAGAPAPAAPAPPRPVKDETIARVESVLEEGMKEAYQQLQPAAKERFKKEGERIAQEISGMIKSLKVKAARVLQLLTRWLRMIPGANKFFLIQEAKIKTDRILALAEEEKKKRGAF